MPSELKDLFTKLHHLSKFEIFPGEGDIIVKIKLPLPDAEEFEAIYLIVY